ncbi:hypothetical protein [Thiomicrospira sp.]|uniref:hypothetical protein n=1 Tax=Thiomicrospira sp. TaxID=935 RepID=UPI002F928628
MIHLGLILATLAVMGIYISLKKYDNFNSIAISPVFYFALLWWLAFPLHAYLIYQGWVDTQQQVVVTSADIIIALWLSLLSMGVVYWGAVAGLRKNVRHVNNACNAGSIERVLIVELMLIILAFYFLARTVFDSGEFIPFVGNDQNENRVGNGPFYLLSELFIYGLIASTPLIFASTRLNPRRLLFLGVIAVGIMLAVYMGIVLNSRRFIVFPLFVLVLAWLYLSGMKYRKLAALVIIGTILSAPFLQALRYSLTPTEAPEQALENESFVDDQLQYKPEDYANYCRYIYNHPSPQLQVLVTDRDGLERRLPHAAASVAGYLCEPGSTRYASYSFIQNIASSFGGIDHLATFIHKSTLIEKIIGVDQGTAWSYNLLLATIPRSIWEEKPLHYGSVAIQKWLYPHMYENSDITMTLPPYFIVDFMFGFGFLSLLVLSYGLGRILAWSHLVLASALLSQNMLRFIFALFVMAYMFNLVRAGTGIIQPFLPILVVIMLMYGIRPFRDFAREFKG